MALMSTGSPNWGGDEQTGPGILVCAASRAEILRTWVPTYLQYKQASTIVACEKAYIAIESDFDLEMTILNFRDVAEAVNGHLNEK